ncbi:MAG: pilus assembly protein PilM [Comamonas sp.]
MVSMMSLFKRQPPALLGIDVSASSIKLVELGRSGNDSYIVERCAQELLEPGWVTESGIERFDEVADSLRRLVKKSGTRTKQAALALPLSAVIQKKIILPAGLSEQEMEFQVESEANQYIPFSLDEVNLDFCVIGPTANSVGDVDVLIAAARKEMVQDRQGLAEAAGLKPVVIEIESNASALAAKRLVENMPSKGKDAFVAVFEIGGHASFMQILHNGEVLYERDQTFNGNQLTQMIMRQYGFSQEEAEQKKRSNDLPADYRKVVLDPFVENIAVEVGRALQFFFTSTPHNRIDHIFLAGGSAVLDGLVESIIQTTGFAASVVNPFENMAMHNASRNRGKGGGFSTYLTACGLAFRRFGA